MNKFRCLIVEDEPVSQDILISYVSQVPQLAVAGVFSNAIEAGAYLSQHEVDLLFLDIQMPRLSGMEFYKSLVKKPPVIFTTAFPEHAASGFEVNAVDYLVKPFPFDRFFRAVNKFLDLSQQSRKQDSHLMLMSDKKMHKVDLADICVIEAMGDYARVFLDNSTLVVHMTLQRLTELLPAGMFRRVHKSFIISLDRLEFVEGNMAVVNKQKVPIGQTYRQEFMDHLRNK